jgi:voltage-gated potassium channel
MDDHLAGPGPARDATMLRTTIARASASAVLIIGLYAALPVRSTSDVVSVLVLVGGILLLVGLVVLRVRQIQKDPSPELRTVEAVALVVPLFVALFAWCYLLLSAADPGAFTEPLNRIDAAYLSLVILSTVGFGDISATSDLSRLLVAAQIVLSLTLLAVAVRVILGAGRNAAAGLRAQTGGRAGQERSPVPEERPGSVPYSTLDHDDDDSEGEHDRAGDETREPGSPPEPRDRHARQGRKRRQQDE